MRRSFIFFLCALCVSPETRAQRNAAAAFLVLSRTPQRPVRFVVNLRSADVPGEVSRLLEKHLKARGGLPAYKKIRVRRTVSVVKVNNQEVKAVTLETPQDGKFYQELESPNAGRIEVGYDGRQVWTRTPQGSQQLTSDDSRARAIRRAALATEFWDYKKDERRFRYAGKETLEGAECDVLESTFMIQTGQDLPAKYYFDQSGLLKVIIAGNDGGTRLEFSDYRTVDGIQYAFRSKFTAPAAGVAPASVVETTISEIKHNTPLDSHVFEYRELALPGEKK